MIVLNPSFEQELRDLVRTTITRGCLKDIDQPDLRVRVCLNILKARFNAEIEKATEALDEEMASDNGLKWCRSLPIFKNDRALFNLLFNEWTAKNPTQSRKMKI
jgi:hypothetical protein